MKLITKSTHKILFFSHSSSDNEKMQILEISTKSIHNPCVYIENSNIPNSHSQSLFFILFICWFSVYFSFVRQFFSFSLLFPYFLLILCMDFGYCYWHFTYTNTIKQNNGNQRERKKSTMKCKESNILLQTHSISERIHIHIIQYTTHDMENEQKKEDLLLSYIYYLFFFVLIFFFFFALLLLMFIYWRISYRLHIL